MENSFNYKKMDFYKRMRELVILVYAATKKFPQDEQGFTGLVSQLKRAIISAVSNTSEGSSRKKREMLHFLSLSLGSLREVDTQINIARDLGYIDLVSHSEISEKLDEAIAKLCNFMKKLNTDMPENK